MSPTGNFGGGGREIPCWFPALVAYNGWSPWTSPSTPVQRGEHHIEKLRRGHGLGEQRGHSKGKHAQENKALNLLKHSPGAKPCPITFSASSSVSEAGEPLPAWL